MKNDLINGFCWREEKPGDSVLKDEEKYKAAVDWAFQARCQNPNGCLTTKSGQMKSLKKTSKF